MNLLDWLGQFLDELWPPWEIVPVTYCAVRQRSVPLPTAVKQWLTGRFFWFPRHGVIVRNCGSGFVFRIPWIDLVDQVPVELVSEDLLNIEVETCSGRTYDISPTLRWKASNPIKFVTRVQDAEESMKNEVRSTILKWANCQPDRIDVEKYEQECSELVRRLGAEWGCFLQGVGANSCAPPWENIRLTHALDAGGYNGPTQP